MGKDNGSRVIAIVALVVAIVGLSLGFAAESSVLNIGSQATVDYQAGTAWNVGLSSETTGLTNGTVNGVTSGNNNNGVMSVASNHLSISQTTPASLTTTNGSQVVYTFYALNEGDLDAYLNEISVGSLSCAYTSATGTISSETCNALFETTLQIGADDAQNKIVKTHGQTQSTGFAENFKLVKKSGTTYAYVPIKLTISYINDSVNTIGNLVDDDFTVTLSSTHVTYGSRQSAAS